MTTTRQQALEWVDSGMIIIELRNEGVKTHDWPSADTVAYGHLATIRSALKDDLGALLADVPTGWLVRMNNMRLCPNDWVCDLVRPGRRIRGEGPDPATAVRNALDKVQL